MNEPIYIALREQIDAQLSELANRLWPAHVLAYLAGAGWCFDRVELYGDAEVWVRHGENDEVVGSVRVPMVADYADFDQCMVDALKTIAAVDGWPTHAALDVPAELREVRKGGGDDV